MVMQNDDMLDKLDTPCVFVGRTPFCPLIYGLIDPLEPKHIRYVGMAMKVGRSFEHAKNAKRLVSKHSYLFHWIRLLQAENREPAVLILEELSEDATRNFVGEVEKMYITSLREIGHKLTNVSGGGWGGHAWPLGGKHSEESKAKQSKAHLGKKHHWRGEQRGSVKLTEEKILEIRADPRTYVEIGRDYDVSGATIRSIKHLQKWQHVEGPPSVFTPGSGFKKGNKVGLGKTHKMSDEGRERIRKLRLGSVRSEESKRKTTESLLKTWAKRKGKVVE